MGAKQSKRSVDISGKEAVEGGAGEVAAAGAACEGRVEQLADGDALKPQLNGDAHIHEHTDKEKQLNVGTPENEKDATTEKQEEVGKGEMTAPVAEGEKEQEAAPVTNGEAEAKPENGESSPTPEEGKKPKKEKVKKKWSLRSISFSRKDKPKQEKKQKDEETKTNGEPEKLPEEAAEVTPEANEVTEEAKPEVDVKEQKSPETPVTEPLTNGSATPDSPKAPSSPAQPEPEQLPINGLSLEDTKPEAPASEEPKPAEPTATPETAPEIPKEVCVEQVALDTTPPPLPANPPPSGAASFAASTMAPESAAAAPAAPASAALTNGESTPPPSSPPPSSPPPPATQTCPLPAPIDIDSDQLPTETPAPHCDITEPIVQLQIEPTPEPKADANETETQEEQLEVNEGITLDQQLVEAPEQLAESTPPELEVPVAEIPLPETVDDLPPPPPADDLPSPTDSIERELVIPPPDMSHEPNSALLISTDDDLFESKESFINNEMNIPLENKATYVISKTEKVTVEMNGMHSEAMNGLNGHDDTDMENMKNKTLDVKEAALNGDQAERSRDEHHSQQETLPVSDKLADLIPDVPVVPEINTETLAETTTDVVAAN